MITDRQACPTDRLASLTANIDVDDLPQALIARLGQCLLDALANAGFAYARADSTGLLLAAIEGIGGAGDSTVIGSPRGFRPEYAALLNGALIHSADFDDTNEAAKIHPAATVVPVTLAIAEQQGSSGRELLAGLAAGYEVSCRVGAALGDGAYTRGFHPTSVAGLFGGVAAGARLRRLDANIIAAGFGVASSMASGTMQFLAGGGFNKRLQPGLAAHSALLALSFAEAGYPPLQQPLEGERGVLHAYSSAPDVGAMVTDLGEQWMAADTIIKPYPSCRLTHSAIDAAIELRQCVALTDILSGSVEIAVSPRAYATVGEPRANTLRPTTAVEAQFSLYFQVAVALLSGTVEMTSLNRLDDADIARVCSRISANSNPSLPVTGAVLRWTPDDNRAQEIEICRVDQPDRASTPAHWTAVERKCAGLLDGIFSPAAQQDLLSGIHNLLALGTVREWLATLRGHWASVHHVHTTRDVHHADT